MAIILPITYGDTSGGATHKEVGVVATRSDNMRWC